MLGLYPEIHPHTHYHFAVDEPHQLYVEEVATPMAFPWCFYTVGRVQEHNHGIVDF